MAGRIGQPPKLTPELEALILAKIRDGMSDTDTCALVGISHSTFSMWIRRGRGEEPGRPQTPLYVGFVSKVTAARVEWKETLQKRVMDATATDWKAAKYLLSVRHPEEFSERVIAQRRAAQLLAELKQAVLAGRQATGAPAGDEVALTPAEVAVFEALMRFGN